MTPAETYIADIVAGLEERHGVGAPTNTNLAVTGDAYVVVCSGGEKLEAEIWPALCSTPELAAELWADAIVRYAEGRTGLIYWRHEPSIERCQMTVADARQTHRVSSDRFAVYSRLFIATAAIATEPEATA